MTLQDAQHGDISPVSVLPVTPIDLAELPTNPLIASVLPADLIPVTPTMPVLAAGAFANSEIVLPDHPSLVDPLTDQASPTFLANPPNGTDAPQLPPSRPQRRKRLDAAAILSICAALLLLALSAGGLIFDLVYYQPYRIHASATATANVAPTSTVHAAQTQIADVEQTITAQEQATATTYQNIYNQSVNGRPFLNESLNQQSSSGWDEGVIWQNSSCTFANGSYDIYQPNQGYFLPCFAENPIFTDFAFQVNIKAIQGDEGWHHVPQR